MGLVSKGLAALVIISIVGMLIYGYGEAKEQFGRQESTSTQLTEALKLKQELDNLKADSNRRLAALQADLDDSLKRANDIKMEMLHKDETYAKFRDIPVHPVTRCRIWGLCDKTPGGSDMRTTRPRTGQDP